MSEESQELKRLHESFRFMAWLLFFTGLYLSQLGFFAKSGLFLPELAVFTDKLLKIRFLGEIVPCRTVCLVFLVVTCIGTKAKKNKELKVSAIVVQILLGTAMYWGSLFVLNFPVTYLTLSFFGFALMNVGFDSISKIINVNLMKDRFNEENECFPQEENWIGNEYSVNLETQYRYKGKAHFGCVNVINPFRGTMVIGTPGSGKSYSVVLPFIKQHLAKGFSMCVYDFKFPDLSQVVYNHFLKAKREGALPGTARFYVINFDDIQHSYRCNPLAPELMFSPIDAFEASRTVLYNLNREWIRKQGEFFSESAVSFFAAVIWFLKKYGHGQFCTLPHAMEMLQMDYDDLFTILSKENDVTNIINPFVNAYKKGAREQLEGQLGSLKIATAKIISKEMYWICSGNDFTLDINAPERPKVLCLANNPLRIEMYGAVLSLYITRMLKIMNRKGGHKASLIFDELPTIYFRGLDTLIATARSNKISTLLGMQTIDQLFRDYGKEQANAILTNIGNIFAGQSVGETAKFVQNRMGKILQQRQGLNIERDRVTSVFTSQFDFLVPEGKMATLPQGQMVGQVADDFDQRVGQRNFNCLIDVDTEEIKTEEKHYKPIPEFYRFDDVEALLENNRNKIINDVSRILMDNT